MAPVSCLKKVDAVSKDFLNLHPSSIFKTTGSLPRDVSTIGMIPVSGRKFQSSKKTCRFQ